MTHQSPQSSMKSDSSPLLKKTSKSNSHEEKKSENLKAELKFAETVEVSAEPAAPDQR